MRTSARVAFPLAGRGVYDYWADASLRPGDFVRAPLGGRDFVGVVWGAATGEAPSDRMRAIRAKVADVPPLPEGLRRFLDWMSGYTLTPLGMALRLALAGSVAESYAPPKGRALLSPSAVRPSKMTPARARALAAVEHAPMAATDLARSAKVSPSVVRGLVAAGVLLPAPAVVRREDWRFVRDAAALGALSQAQHEAAAVLREAVRARAFAPTLLEGVTGSGKTEVYFEAVAEALAMGRQALILTPEIALAEDLARRFAQRFGVEAALWHSERTPLRRRMAWRGVRDGSARAVIGARSALFLPFADLGALVVDEEHDHAYKQDEGGALYQGRDMAIVRAKLESIPIALVSATPSMETLTNVKRGRCAHLRLTRRHGAAQLPKTRLVDLRYAPPPSGFWLAPPAREAIAGSLARRAQALVFLNRRGFAPVVICRGCGQGLACTDCDAWLAWHRAASRLLCHHCGASRVAPKVCPRCEAPAEKLVACGPGVERVARELADIFPDARLAMVSSDMPRARSERMAIFERMAAGELDILVGTQIIAKGHHFPLLDTAVAVDADLGLDMAANPRAAERAYQMLAQFAGRAGRAEAVGTAWIQTHQPESAVMRALLAGDAQEFQAAEAQARESAGAPPFGRMAALIVSARDKAKGEAYAWDLARAAPSEAALRVLGPAVAPFARLRGRWRWRFSVLGSGSGALAPPLDAWRHRCPPPSGVRLVVDIDPYGFF